MPREAPLVQCDGIARGVVGGPSDRLEIVERRCVRIRAEQASLGGTNGDPRPWPPFVEIGTAIKVVGRLLRFALLNFPQYPMQRYETFIFPVRQ